MPTTLIIHDEDVRGNRFHTLRVPVNQESISVEEIIKARIETEIKKFNIQRPVCFFSLVQPQDSEVTPRGFRLKEHRVIDWQVQLDAALNAFKKNKFLVSANEKDYKKLDDQIDLRSSNEITFVKFMDIIAG